MLNNKESRNNMTIGQKIKKAKNIFAWVLIYAPDDGEYIKVSKKHLRQIIMNTKGGLSEDVFRLDDDVIIYPGHGPSTTIRDEINENPFLK